MKKKFEVKEKCPPCEGTGLYIGFAERDGAAVVCSDCKGTGCRLFIYEYEDFEKRVDAGSIVKRVYRVNPGIGIGVGKNNEFKLSDFGGMPYEDWVAGKRFPAKSENRKCTCPAWWYQTADYNKKPNWKECIACGSFSACDHFKNKQKCWDKFDR
jgi:hypothetical protein